jgi:hypothetical protein
MQETFQLNNGLRLWIVIDASRQYTPQPMFSIGGKARRVEAMESAG